MYIYIYYIIYIYLLYYILYILYDCIYTWPWHGSLAIYGHLKHADRLTFFLEPQIVILKKTWQLYLQNQVLYIQVLRPQQRKTDSCSKYVLVGFSNRFSLPQKRHYILGIYTAIFGNTYCMCVSPWKKRPFVNFLQTQWRRWFPS